MMDNKWINEADALKTAVAKVLGAPLREVSDDAIYDFVLTCGVESLADNAGDDFKKLTRNEKHAVVATLISRVHPHDGIELHEVGQPVAVPVWIRVAPAEEGRLPARMPEKWRWVRLDTITEIIPEVGIGVGEDPEEWQHTLAVTAGGRKYHATAVRFRGSMVKAPVERLLRIVAGALLNARHA